MFHSLGIGPFDPFLSPNCPRSRMFHNVIDVGSGNVLRPLWMLDCAFLRLPKHFSQLWCPVKVCSLLWQRPKGCRDPAKVLTSTPRRRTRPLSSPSCRCCSGPVGCPLSIAPLTGSSTGSCSTGWLSWSSVGSEEMVGNQFPVESRWVSDHCCDHYSDHCCGQVGLWSGFLGLGSELASPMMLCLVLA